MEEQQQAPQQVPQQPPVKTKKSHLKPVLLALLVIVLVGGISYSVYGYIKSYRDENNLLKQDLAKQTADKEEASEGADTASANDGVEYSAKVGKFALTLTDKYGILVLRDGGGEGAPATKLSIPTATSNTGVYESLEYVNDVTIEAVSLKSLNSTFEAQVKAALKDTASTKVSSPPSFSGVTSQQYSLGGLGNPQIVFFSRGDIMYTINLADKNEVTSEKLKAIAEGFSFN